MIFNVLVTYSTFHTKMKDKIFIEFKYVFILSNLFVMVFII